MELIRITCSKGLYIARLVYNTAQRNCWAFPFVSIEESSGYEKKEKRLYFSQSVGYSVDGLYKKAMTIEMIYTHSR
jgi:hypothetical protein